jgi:hypothetical protein
LSGERAFTIVHALLAFAAARVEHHAARGARLLRKLPASLAPRTPAHDLALAIPLADGLRGLRPRDYAAASIASRPCARSAYRCGGSIAQCDLIHLTLVEAALRAHRHAAGTRARGRARGAPSPTAR